MATVYKLSPGARHRAPTLSGERDPSARLQLGFLEAVLRAAEVLRRKGISEESIDLSIRFTLEWGSTTIPTLEKAWGTLPTCPPEPPKELEFYEEEPTTLLVEFPET